jgi:hypothetical protein
LELGGYLLAVDPSQPDSPTSNIATNSSSNNSENQNNNHLPHALAAMTMQPSLLPNASNASSSSLVRSLLSASQAERKYILDRENIAALVCTMLEGETMDKNYSLLMAHDRLQLYLNEYFFLMEHDALIRLLLNYEVLYAHKVARIYVAPFLIACKETERHMLSEFYARKGHRLNRYFYISGLQPLTMFPRIYATLFSTYHTGCCWNPSKSRTQVDQEERIEYCYGWSSHEQVLLFYKLNASTSAIVRFESDLVMVELVSVAQPSSSSSAVHPSTTASQPSSAVVSGTATPSNLHILFFCALCHFIRQVIRNLYWKLDIDEVIECACKGHPFDLPDLFQAMLAGTREATVQSVGLLFS